MATDFGQFGPVVAASASLLAATSAIFLAWKKRASWEPAEEDLPNLAQRVAGLVAAVAIACVWYFQDSWGPSGRSSLISIAVWCAVAVVVCAVVYGLLVGIYTYDREVAIGPKTTVHQKIVGGLVLTSNAQAIQRKNKVTTQELFKGSGYDADKLWSRTSRSLAKSGFLIAYIGLVVSGTLALATAGMGLVQPSGPATASTMLATSTARWINEALTAKSNRTIVAAAPLPTGLAASRSEFETAWRNAGLTDRLRLTPDDAAKALSYAVGVYRIEEQNQPVKTNSLHWADEAIRHFEERQDRPRLVEALLDKAAIMLDLAQMGNTDRENFENVSRTGDALMTRTAEIASPQKKAEVLRLSSRFYYNLARPKSFRLSDAWDNNYLLLAHERAERAFSIAPLDIKNANQLLRAAMKAAKNPPQDGDREWSKKLRNAQRAMQTAWAKNDALTTSDRISPLNVLGSGTLEAVARDWKDLPTTLQRGNAEAMLAEIANDSLPKLREAEALLRNGELRIAYGFDIYYDIARTYAQRVVMLRVVDRQRSNREFEQVELNLARARENANSTQLDAAFKDVDRDLSFSTLGTPQRLRLKAILRGEAK